MTDQSISVKKKNGGLHRLPPSLTRETASSEGWEFAPQAPRPHTDRMGQALALETAECIGGKPHNEMDPKVKCVPVVSRWFLVVSLSLGSWCWSASTVRVLALKVRETSDVVRRNRAELVAFSTA